MKITAVTMVRDEADIIGSTIAHLLAEGVDEVIAADNRSADGTSEILDDLASTHPVVVVPDDEVGYWQARKMTGLARLAAERGAEWIVPFDADEFWCANEGLGTLREAIDSSPFDVLYAPAYEHPPTEDPHLRRYNPRPLAKVTFRWHPDAELEMGNHEVAHPGSRRYDRLVIHEFPYRSLEQLRRKIRNGLEAYAATDLSAHYGEHWRELGALSEDELLQRWEEMTDPSGLFHDPWEPKSGFAR